MTLRSASRSSRTTAQTAIQLHGTPLGGCRVALGDLLAELGDPCGEHSAVQIAFPRFLNTEQAAAVLGISPSTLNRWAARRDAGEEVGPPFRAVSDKVRRWSVDELLAWLDAQKR